MPLCLRLLGEKKKKRKQPSPSFVPLKYWIRGFSEFDVGQVRSKRPLHPWVCKQDLVVESKKKKNGGTDGDQHRERERERCCERWGERLKE